MFSSAKISIIPDYAKYFGKKLSTGNWWQLAATNVPFGCRTFALSLVRRNLLVGVGKLFPTCTKKNSYV